MPATSGVYVSNSFRPSGPTTPLATRLPFGSYSSILGLRTFANAPGPSPGVAVWNCTGFDVSVTSTMYQSSVCGGTRSNCVTTPHAGEPGPNDPTKPLVAFGFPPGPRTELTTDCCPFPDASSVTGMKKPGGLC